MKQSILKYGLLIYFSLIYSLPALADPNDPDPGENDEEYQAPIDNWEILLVTAAIVLGIYFMTKYRKNSSWKQIRNF